MKKIIFLSVMLILCTAFVSAMDLKTFPLGKWVDSNWNATWEFTSSNIRVLNGDGSVAYDFDGNIQNFQFKLEGTVPMITFDCEATGRSYKFYVAAMPKTDLSMQIERTNGDSYKVVMKKQ